MYIALIDKDLFANLLRYGEINLPDYSFSAISSELPIEEALRLILRDGNPIEYPSQYIIAIYDVSTPSILTISSIQELVATDSGGKRLFSTQFRQDLLIQPERYQNIFQEYLDNAFQKTEIKKGIRAFRALCGLKDCNNYDEEVDLIYHGLANRIKYRHHFQLPAEEREEPYALMIAYDRHAPYPRGWAGYYYDVIESYCYHQKPALGYSESVIEGTGIYKLINSLPSDSTSKFIDDTIKDEKFTHLCNEFYNKPGGYLTPLLFFILRDIFRDTDSFSMQSKLIAQLNNQFPEAFDTASIFVGGFFGYKKFYDDYYSILNLPILKSQIPWRSAESNMVVPVEGKKQTVGIKSERDKLDAVADKEGGIYGDNVISDTKDTSASEDKTSLSSEKEPLSHDTQDANSPCQELGDVFSNGTSLYIDMCYIVNANLSSENVTRKKILGKLRLHMYDDKELENIKELFLSDPEEKESIKKSLGLYRYNSSVMKVRGGFQEFYNK